MSIKNKKIVKSNNLIFDSCIELLQKMMANFRTRRFVVALGTNRDRTRTKNMYLNDSFFDGYRTHSSFSFSILTFNIVISLESYHCNSLKLLSIPLRIEFHLWLALIRFLDNLVNNGRERCLYLCLRVSVVLAPLPCTCLIGHETGVSMMYLYVGRSCATSMLLLSREWSRDRE